MIDPPYEFTQAYAHCFDDAPTAMDRRHVFTLFEILRSWPFASALECGSYLGASSTAFVEAINRDPAHSMVATFCDTTPTESLRSVVGHCVGKTTITAQPSESVLKGPEDYEFVLLDSAHDMEAVAREGAAVLKRRPLAIAVHDTSATVHGYGFAEGAAMLAYTLRNTSGYHTFEDNIRRPGERTERGFFVAVSHPKLAETVHRCFEKWSA